MATGQEIEKEFGIPIVNKRISVTPIALVGGSACSTPEDFVTIAKTLDRAAKTVGVNFLGRLFRSRIKGNDVRRRKSDPLDPDRRLHETDFVCSSVNVGSTQVPVSIWMQCRLLGDDDPGDGGAHAKSTIPLAVRNWLCSAMHRTTIRSWREHSTA